MTQLQESNKLCEFELELLEAIRDNKSITWGAATSVCLEYLRNSGYITEYVGAQPIITYKGYVALSRWRNL